MECSEIIEKTIETLRLGFKCIPSERRICVITPYLYPDNDLIEVFIDDMGANNFRVTDLGETLRHLESVGLDLLGSRKRRFLLEQITQRLHVNNRNGKLEKEGSADEIGSILVDVTAAAHAVSDLIYTSKAYEPATFIEEVSLFLSEREIKHDKNYKVLGETGKTYRVSLRIDGSRPAEILVETLSPPQETAMTATVNRALRKWFDINGSRRKISLFNDIDYIWKDEDKALLQRVSVIHNWSNKERFLEYVQSD